MSTIIFKKNTFNGKIQLGDNNTFNNVTRCSDASLQNLKKGAEVDANTNCDVASFNKREQEKENSICVFISYSWDSEEHRQWVRKLADNLLSNGIRVVYDQNTHYGTPLPHFMNKGIREADRVLIIGTPNYLHRSTTEGAGCQFEDYIVTEEIYKRFDTIKFVPILRSGNFHQSFPPLIANRKWLDFSDDTKFSSRMNELIRELKHNLL